MNIGIHEIFEALDEEFTGKLFSDNFLKVQVYSDVRPPRVLIKFEMDKPEDLDEDNPDDREWWQDKVDSALLFYGDVVKFLVDTFGEEFDYSEVGVDDEYANKSNYKGRFTIEQDQDAEDEMPTITIYDKERMHETRPFSERTTYCNPAQMESAIFAALNKLGGVISVDRTVHGYIVTTRDRDFKVDVDIQELE